MDSNQTNRFQSLADSSIEEFIDEHESENAKKRAKHNVALFHEFLALKDETKAERGIRTRNTRLIPNLNFRRTISTHFQDVLCRLRKFASVSNTGFFHAWVHSA